MWDMERPRRSRKFGAIAKGALDVATSLALLCAAIVIIRFVLNAQPRRQSVESYRVGDSFTAIPIDQKNKTLRTLIIFIGRQCPSCADSMPFYHKLQAAPTRPRLVVVSYDDDVTASSYVRENGFVPDEIHTLRPGLMRNHPMPTLMLLDSDGLIRHLWPGRLTPALEEDVLDALADGLSGPASSSKQ